MAAEYDLVPIYKEEFHQVFDEHQEHPEFGPLMVRMKVVDANGESAMDEDQWEAASTSDGIPFLALLTSLSHRHLYRLRIRKTIIHHYQVPIKFALIYHRRPLFCYSSNWLLCALSHHHHIIISQYLNWSMHT